MPAKDTVSYIVAQCIGATLASLSIVVIWGSRSIATGLGATAMADGVSYGQAILCEAVATFFLMLVIMGTAIDKRSPAGFGGLIIGSVVAADIIVIGNITGSSLNPARTFGPYLVETIMGGTNLWWQFPIYITGPVLGALVAAFAYDFIADLKNGE
jgi:glycerol uptake facilitator protein